MQGAVNKRFIFLILLGALCCAPSTSFGLVSYDYDGNINFSWTAPSGEVPDHYNVYRSTDGITYTSVGTATTTAFQFAGTSGTSYWLQVEAVDLAGNVGPKSDPSDEVKMLLDLNPPTASISSPAASAYLNGSGTVISGVAADGAESGVATVELSLDGGTTWVIATGTTNWSYNWTLPADGSYTLKVRATDLSGKVQVPGAGTSVKVDNTAPTSTISSPLANASLIGTTYTITGTAVDGSGSGINKVEVSTDGGATWVSASGSTSWSYNWTLPASGNFTIKSRATDQAGNVETSSIGTLVAVNADTTAPTGTVAIQGGFKGGKYISTASVTLALSASDGESGMGTGAQMSFSNDGQTWSTPETYTSQKAWTLTTGDGLKTVFARFKDVAGNWTTAVITDSITLDTSIPSKPGKPLYSSK